jgi:hypothetical protein
LLQRRKFSNQGLVDTFKAAVTHYYDVIAGTAHSDYAFYHIMGVAA